MATRSYRSFNPAIGEQTLPIFESDGAPTNGTSGTFAGVAIPGALLITGEVALYQNTNTTASPTWNPIIEAGQPATEQAQPSAPTAPNSTSAFKMQGLAGTITPAKSGVIMLVISGTIIGSTTTVGDGISYELSYGTGTAPTNNTALAGTQVGATQQYTNPTTVTAADIAIPFSIQAVISGLTVGTAYWLDLAAKSLNTASAVGLTNISITAHEI